MLIATLHILIPMSPFLMIHPFHIMTKPCHQITFLHKLHQILILLQKLTHLFNEFFNLLVPINPVTEPVTHLKTNLQHLPLQIIEIPKLIIIQDNNRKWIIVFSYQHPNSETFFHFIVTALTSHIKSESNV